MMDYTLECQLIQQQKKSGTVRLIDPIEKNPQPGQLLPDLSPTVFFISFTDPGEANKFGVGKKYSVSITEIVE